MKTNPIELLRLNKLNKHFWVLIVSTMLVSIFALLTVEYIQVPPLKAIPVTVDTKKYLDLLAGRISQYSTPEYLIRRRLDLEHQIVFTDFFAHNGKFLGTINFSFQDLERLNENKSFAER